MCVYSVHSIFLWPQGLSSFLPVIGGHLECYDILEMPNILSIDLETVVRAAGERAWVSVFHPEFSPPCVGWVSLQTQPVLLFLLSGSHIPGNAMTQQSCPGGRFSRTHSINYLTSLVLQSFESTMFSALVYYLSSSQSLLYPVDILRNPPSPDRLMWSQQVRPSLLLFILLVAYMSLYDLPQKKKKNDIEIPSGQQGPGNQNTVS